MLSLIGEGLLDTLLKAAEPQPHTHHSSNNMLKRLVGNMVETIHSDNLARQTVLTSSTFPGLLDIHPCVLAALGCEVSLFRSIKHWVSKLGMVEYTYNPSALEAEAAGCDMEACLPEQQCLSCISRAHPKRRPQKNTALG